MLGSAVLFVTFVLGRGVLDKWSFQHGDKSSTYISCGIITVSLSLFPGKQTVSDCTRTRDPAKI